jgi:hypothetical protein
MKIIFAREDNFMISKIKKLFLKSTNKTSIASEMPSQDPDYPLPFGYKCQWLAIKTSDINKVINELAVSDLQKSNWHAGLEHAYNDMIFIAPVVKDWVLVIGSTLPNAGDTRQPNLIKPLITKLSEVFGEVHYFGTHRVVEYHAWAKARDGKIERAFCYLGEAGEVLWNEGNIQQEEKDLDFQFDKMDSEECEDVWFPDEEHVLSIAKMWSLDPLMEYEDLERGTGFLGKLHM